MRVIITYCIIPLFIVFGHITDVSAAPEDITLKIETSTRNITLGDSLSLFCTVTVPDDVIVSEPHLEERSPLYELQKRWEKLGNDTPRATTHRYNYLLYVFSPDTLRIGPLNVAFVTAGGDRGIVSSGLLVLPVSSVISDSTAAPRPNRSPLEIAATGVPIWLWVLIVLLFVLAVCYAVYHFFFRRKKPAQQVIEKPIDELEEFERIRRMHLRESGELKKLYILVSSALRGFIHRNMELDALFETTEEIRKNLERTRGSGDISRLFTEILDESDQVKFAKYLPPIERSSSVIDRALAPVKEILDERARARERERAAQAETLAEPSAEPLPDPSGR